VAAGVSADGACSNNKRRPFASAGIGMTMRHAKRKKAFRQCRKFFCKKEKIFSVGVAVECQKRFESIFKKKITNYCERINWLSLRLMPTS